MNLKIALLWRGLCLAFLAQVATASESTGTYDVGLPHPRTNVPYAQALADAQAIARQNMDWEVARCEGFSMSPFFTERSVLLVKKLPFEKLRVGMVAIYQDADGDIVAHKVVKADAEGWLCRAYQNDTGDPTPVTAENFHGIAFAVFNAASGPEPELLAQISPQILAVMGKQYQRKDMQ